MSISIKNKIALVTGANRGIGKTITETFLKHGAKKVYLAVRDISSTKELEDTYGDRVVTVEADVSNTQSIQDLAKETKDVEIVVNNAGIGTPCSVLDKDVEKSLTEEFNVNTLGFVRMANAFSKILESNKGTLVQLNSVASIKNFPHLATYSASKAASYSLTQALRNELEDKGVQILSVHPGPVDTDMGQNAGFEDGASTDVISEGIVNALQAGDFHLFPDEMAKEFESAYNSFAEKIVLADNAE